MAKLATGLFANNDWWYRGRTNNPWDLKRGSSGSSHGGGGSSSGAGSGSTGSADGKSGLGPVKGSLGETLSRHDAGGTVGSLVGGVGGGTQGGLGGSVGSTVQQVTKGAGDAVQQVGGTAGQTVQQVGGTVNGLPSTSVPGVQNTLKQTTSALPQTPVTVPGVKLPSTKLTP